MAYQLLIISVITFSLSTWLLFQLIYSLYQHHEYLLLFLSFIVTVRLDRIKFTKRNACQQNERIKSLNNFKRANIFSKILHHYVIMMFFLAITEMLSDM